MYNLHNRNKKTNLRHGLGVQLWADGSKYEGMWKDGKCHGKGRMTHANGDIYEGEWANDKANGNGLFMDASGASYKGEWMNDLQHGLGDESWGNGKTRYVGQFYKGTKSG